MDWTGCELVEQVPDKVSRRSIVRGTRIMPEAIIGDYELGSPLKGVQENDPSVSMESIKEEIRFTQQQVSTKSNDCGFGEAEIATKDHRQDEEGWNWEGCDLVERVPGKVSGKPLVRGTRILADTIAGDYELGSPIEEIEENYPTLSGETIRQLVTFAHGARL